MLYRENDVCVVGYGGVFPGSNNADEFIADLFEGKNFLCDLRVPPLSSYPFDAASVFNPDKKAEDQSYCYMGAYIDRTRMPAIAEKNGVDAAKITSLELVTIEAVRQALAGLRDQKDLLSSAEIVLGASGADAESESAYVNEQLGDRLRTYLREHGFSGADGDAARSAVRDYQKATEGGCDIVTSRLVKTLKSHFKISGAGHLIDAACASSLAAFYLSIRRLKQGEADLVLAGGTDVSLHPGSLVLFSRVGAMSSGKTLPLDHKTEGFNQGEGSAVFALMRLSDALKRGLPVHAVLGACEGASDGRASSVVEPTVEGQMLAYQRVYGSPAGSSGGSSVEFADASDVDYVETHGTGTVIGDKTEIESLTRFFHHKKIPIGSVKSNIGHTIGAAGAAGLMKAIGVIQKRAVPPSPYFEKFQSGVKTHLYVNKSTVSLKKKKGPVTVGLSSFGFGGSNYHMVLREFQPSEAVHSAILKDPSPVVVCGSEFYCIDRVEELLKNSQLRIPPNSLAWIDRMQLLGILAVEKTCSSLGILPWLLEREKVSVISASMLSLDTFWKAARRITSVVFKDRIPPKIEHLPARKAVQACFQELIADSARITEDTVSGMLNNVIAGRICNAFDFKGVSFNIDASTASPAAALKAARTILCQSHGMVILVSSDDDVAANDHGHGEIRRSGLSCSILANAGFAFEHDLPISYVLKSVSYEEDANVEASIAR